MRLNQEQVTKIYEASEEKVVSEDVQKYIKIADTVIEVVEAEDRLSKVKEFHKTFDATIADSPVLPSKEDLKLRYTLILEELKELAEASGTLGFGIFTECLDNTLSECEIMGLNGEAEVLKYDPTEVADAFADLEYVTNGTILTYGHGDSHNSIFYEVHKSNMTKACADENEAKNTLTTLPKNFKYKVLNNSVNSLYIKRSDGKVIKSINYMKAKVNTILYSIFPHLESFKNESIG